MDKYYKRMTHELSSSVVGPIEVGADDSVTKKARIEFNLEELSSDPGLRQPISSYNVNDQERIRRYYLQKGPCQPKLDSYPQTEIGGGKRRRFCSGWFENHRGWLEYSVAKDALFCLQCYVFPQTKHEEAFVSRGFRNWKNIGALAKHVGTHNSPHNASKRMCNALMNQKQSIPIVFGKQTSQETMEYRIRLTASINCIRLLLKQGLSFRGHDESWDAANRGNFLELLEWLSEQNESIKAVTLKKAPGNCQLTSPKTQRDIVSVIASATSEAIITDLGDDYFTVLVDESRDVSSMEQMAIVIRYVDREGEIIERFLGIVHVECTTSLTLKNSLENFFARFGLSFSQLRGQGYDGASNMRGEFSGLKTLILKENSCAFYIHCFAHQLQLVIVAVAKSQVEVSDFFAWITTTINVVGGSCKRRDALRAKELDRVASELCSGEIKSGQGLHQPLEIKRASDTRWSSHYGTILNFIRMFSSIISVVHYMMDEGGDSMGQASHIFTNVQNFNFVFNLFFMKKILAITYELSQALQRKDQNIVNAMKLVKITKEMLNNLRNDDEEWESLIEEILLFCKKHDIDSLDMDEPYFLPGRSKRMAARNPVTNLHHYRFEIFNRVIDRVLIEINDRFSETSTELLLCVSCLDPTDNFAAFEKKKLLRLAELYHNDFSETDLQMLDGQLNIYILDMRSSDEFSQLNGINDLLKRLVKLKMHHTYNLVFRLLKLACLLPVATATVERVFSAMKIIKSRLRNRMGDELMADCLLSYIEKDVVANISNETIMERFQNMRSRRKSLT